MNKLTRLDTDETKVSELEDRSKDITIAHREKTIENKKECRRWIEKV